MIPTAIESKSRDFPRINLVTRLTYYRSTGERIQKIQVFPNKSHGVVTVTHDWLAVHCSGCYVQAAESFQIAFRIADLLNLQRCDVTRSGMQAFWSSSTNDSRGRLFPFLDAMQSRRYIEIASTSRCPFRF